MGDVLLTSAPPPGNAGGGSGGGGDGGGAKVAIVVAAVVPTVVVLASAIGLLYWHRKRKMQRAVEEMMDPGAQEMGGAKGPAGEVPSLGGVAVEDLDNDDMPVSPHRRVDPEDLVAHGGSPHRGSLDLFGADPMMLGGVPLAAPMEDMPTSPVIARVVSGTANDWKK